MSVNRQSLDDLIQSSIFSCSVSIRKGVIYEGELSPTVKRSGYFDALVDIEGFLRDYLRGARPPPQVGGHKRRHRGFKGIFASDRYSGYEFVAGQRSFCLEHLKRDAIKVREDNPESRECAAYADAIVPVLAEIMKLRSVFGEDPKAYRRAALDAGRRLYEIVHREAKHPDIQKHQDVFRDARLRTWQWLIGPEVPADNNRSEAITGK